MPIYGDVSIGQLTNGISANMGVFDHTSPLSVPTTTSTISVAVAIATNPSLKQGMESYEWSPCLAFLKQLFLGTFMGFNILTSSLKFNDMDAHMKDTCNAHIMLL